MNNVEVSYMRADVRPPFLLTDVRGADFSRVKAQRAPEAPTFILKDVQDFSIQQSHPMPNKRLERAKQERL